MAENKKTYATSFEVKQMSLYTVGEDTTPYGRLDGDMCKQCQYFEDELFQKNIKDIKIYNISDDINKIENYKIIKE